MKKLNKDQLRNIVNEAIEDIATSTSSDVSNVNPQISDEEEEISDELEEALRLRVRKMIAESWDGEPDDFGGTEEDDPFGEDELEITNKDKIDFYGEEKPIDNSVESTGGMKLEDIANELGISIAGAKRIIDTALEKATFFSSMDEAEYEVMILTAVKDYVKYLKKSGELTQDDIDLMLAHPKIVADLPNFRDFLHKYYRRAVRASNKEA